MRRLSAEALPMLFALALTSLLPALQSTVSGSSAGFAPPEQVSSLTYQLPAGWISQRDPRTGLTSLAPRGLPFGRVCVLTVFLPENFAGSAAAFHDEVVRRG